MADSQAKTIWMPLYDRVVSLHLKGLRTCDIAKEMNKSTRWVGRIKSSPLFAGKCAEVTKREQDTIIDVQDRLNQKKGALVNRMIDLAENAEKDTTKFMATAWLLERFPELAPKNVPTIVQATTINQLSKEELERNEVAANKLEKAVFLLREGNPNVVSFDEEDNEDEPLESDFTREDTDAPRGDSTPQE